MKNKFPYKGDTVTVTKDMCDMNGHMNVSFYSRVFDEVQRLHRVCMNMML